MAGLPPPECAIAAAALPPSFSTHQTPPPPLFDPSSHHSSSSPSPHHRRPTCGRGQDSPSLSALYASTRTHARTHGHICTQTDTNPKEKNTGAQFAPSSPVLLKCKHTHRLQVLRGVSHMGPCLTFFLHRFNPHNGRTFVFVFGGVARGHTNRASAAGRSRPRALVWGAPAAGRRPPPPCPLRAMPAARIELQHTIRRLNPPVFAFPPLSLVPTSSRFSLKTRD